jgi:hypothetical protein
MSKIQKILKRLNKSNLLNNDLIPLQEMSNLDTDDTGLSKGVVWIGTKSAYGTQIQHGARVKYTDENNTNFKISVSISDDPKVIAGKVDSIPATNLKELYKWIRINKTKLLDYWREGDTYITKKFIAGLKKI